MSRPCPEVKSRRGAPKRVNPEGLACPNLQCLYFGLTEAHLHAAFRRWQAWSGRTDPDRSRPCRSYDVHCPAPHPSLPSENSLAPDRQGAHCAGRRTEPFRCRAGRRAPVRPPSPAFLTRAGRHTESLHERCLRTLHIPHLQLDELGTWLRCAKQALWLWLASDPLTKILPVLELGPRTQTMAHRLLHSLRQILAPGCIPLFTSEGLHLSFYAARGALWDMARTETPRAERASVAGGGGLDLWPGEKKLPAAQAGSGDPRDAPLERDGSQGRLAGTRASPEA